MDAVIHLAGEYIGLSRWSKEKKHRVIDSRFGHSFVLERLKLDTFVLGFSFPVSLISMSVIFALMKSQSISPNI